MADVYFAIQSDKPGSSLVVLIDAEPSTTGYTIQRNGGVDLGAAVYDKVYSGPRGTQGAKLVGATAQNRLSTWTLQVTGTSEDNLQAKLSVLWALDEELRAYGGTAYWRAWGSSFRMELEVLDSGIQVVAFDPDLWVENHRLNVQLGLVTPAYMNGPCMDILDNFSTDTETNYTFDAGAAGDVAVTGGLTAVANFTTEKRMIHTSVGYNYGDVQATIRAKPGFTITSFLAGVILNRWDANNYIRVYVDDNGTNSRLRIDVVVGGTVTNRASTNLGSRFTGAGPWFWVRGRLEGANIFAEFFAAAPSPMATPTTSTSYTLSAVEQTKFSPNILGKAGIDWIPQANTSILDDFQVEPFTYANRTLPEEKISLAGAVPGDAPALAEAFITPSGGSAAPVWAGFGWWPATSVWNRVWNGDFENSALVALGWSVAAVTNINGAATSIIRTSAQGGQYGSFAGQIVCPATSGTGANFRIFGRFRKGITYTAVIGIHAASASTLVQAKLGNAAANDVATSGNYTLASTWQPATVQWTPTADRDDAHIGIVIAAATATTFEIDGVMVYEGTTAPTSANQTEGRGGFPPVGLIEAENSIFGATANVNFRSGSGSLTGNAPTVVIDPTLLVPDDYGAKNVAIEVWGRAELIFGTTTGAAVLSATPLSATVGLSSIYSDEFGSVGKTLVMPSAGIVRRFVRLGTLRLPTDGGRYLLKVGTTNAAFDYFVLLPAQGRALSPSGRANDSTYPDFAPATTELTRRIRADLSGTLREPSSGAPESSASGLGGSLIEMHPGVVETVVKLSSLVPDDPTSNTTTEQLTHSATAHFAVTPRWRLGRSS